MKVKTSDKWCAQGTVWDRRLPSDKNAIMELKTAPWRITATAAPPDWGERRKTGELQKNEAESRLVGFSTKPRSPGRAAANVNNSEETMKNELNGMQLSAYRT